ncbi:MAG: 16S rRNA (uracil(1498)-N(3))-methyltransferase [Chlamydiae bacterium]|nr:16S rRNA (uracil(1498)-N(3))-methyltransferase [Chlamydiota bacterium]MBI3276881.1 16S rRNA (uracil(1498)-N(3))-methyltransferase [Chlamydiota bacterium]
MTSHRIYIKKEIEVSQELILEGEEAHHLLHVVRVKPLNQLILFTPQAREFLAQVKEISKKDLILQVLKERQIFEKPYKMILAQAIPKSQKMDWIVEKASEIGVDEIFPLFTERVVKKTIRIDRWQKIAIAACQQCRRVNIPQVHSVQTWDEFILKTKEFDLALIPTLGRTDRQTMDGVVDQGNKFKNVVIAIGPEGDFSPSEVEKAIALGWIPIDLGPMTLRSETAAITSLAILDHELRKKLKV